MVKSIPIFLGLVLSAAFFTPALSAQTSASTPGDEPAIDLKPFTINVLDDNLDVISRPSNPEEIQEGRAAGERAKGDLAGAIAADKKLIELTKSYGFTYWALDGAIGDFDKAIQLNPKDAEAYFYRGLFEDKRGPDRALADFNEAIALKPEFTQAYQARGDTKAQKHDYEDAKADFGKVIELNPKSADAYAYRGNFLNETMHDRDGAIADYSQAIALDPNRAENYLTRAGLEKNEAAIADYSKAIQLNPNDPRPYSCRARIYCYQGHLDHALADCDQAVKLSPSNPSGALNERGWVKFQKGELDGALADFSNGKNDDGYNYRADVEQAKGDFEAAINDYINANDSLVRQFGDRFWYFTRDRFYLFLTLRRLHRDVGPAGLDVATIGKSIVDLWSKAVRSYLTGQLSEADLLAQIEPTNKLITGHHGFIQHGVAFHDERFKCEGFYYVGMMHLLANDPKTAEQFFKKCLAAPLPFDTESLLARAELARLQAKN